MPLQQRPIKVFLVEDHKCILWGLERLIGSAHPDMLVAGAAHSRAEALAGIARSQPDVVLLDLDLGNDNGLDLLPAIVQPARRALILTGTRERAVHEQAVSLGASGIVSKSDSADVLLAAIKRVHAGELWLDRATMARVLDSFIKGSGATKPAAAIDPLTAKERQIVRAIVAQRGATSDFVAVGLCMSGHTLRNHLTVIYRKLDVKNRLELVLYALENDLGAPTEERKKDKSLP
jgi:two-component system, NarL family, nitrate/nitrite response regulator NarL